MEELMDDSQVQRLNVLPRILTKRFGPVPQSVLDRINEAKDPERLEMLLDAALSAKSIEEFERSLP